MLKNHNFEPNNFYGGNETHLKYFFPAQSSCRTTCCISFKSEKGFLFFLEPFKHCVKPVSCDFQHRISPKGLSVKL